MKITPSERVRVLSLPLRKEGHVSGVERRSMRSGEAIVGGMVA